MVPACDHRGAGFRRPCRLDRCEEGDQRLELFASAPAATRRRRSQTRCRHRGAAIGPNRDEVATVREGVADHHDGLPGQLNDAIKEVSDDADALRDSASDAAADDVEALGASVDALENSISELGGALSRDNVTAVGDAIGEVSASAQAVLSTLSDCWQG